MTYVLIVLVIIALVFITYYNRLVKLRQTVRNAWSDIDVQLKRRHDLVPNLVETVKGYASHEQETLDAVIKARNSAISAAGPAEAAAAENQLSGALRQLFALSESYPQLRAVEGFTELQGSLKEIEEAVQNSRRYYNAVVRDYNTTIEQVPSNIVANAFRFQPEEFFELDSREERDVPKVDFGTSTD
ncbi:MAG: LemA family protein [marine benthic group bacterium]|jgi:LemA protein|nr:LemA family protein [Gemmatimonadota bacterium]MCL7963653.1 LemA family protein [Candidatus Carthagonibacter metallireducens]MCL7937316.1 LemA family protein [Gemmatimonadota bacterium]MCL7956789.1 LemA family protein [Gemmatimonadota bacterium]MCL7964227.1 LemA family protein [Gemmatimonadota bacterium]